MHEMSVTQNILEIVLAHADEVGARRVARIDLTVGRLNGIVPESVEFYFEYLSRDTKAAGAMLRFEMVAARARCRPCRTEYELEEFRWECPACGRQEFDVVAGKELKVATIEVE